MKVIVWSSSRKDLPEDDAKRVDISLLSISAIVKDLWSHPMLNYLLSTYVPRTPVMKPAVTSLDNPKSPILTLRGSEGLLYSSVNRMLFK